MGDQPDRHRDEAQAGRRAVRRRLRGCVEALQRHGRSQDSQGWFCAPSFENVFRFRSILEIQFSRSVGQTDIKAHITCLQRQIIFT